MTKNLEVRHVSQRTELDCGAAAFEMVYKFLRPSRLSKFNADRFFNKRKVIDPHAPQLRLDTIDLVQAAKGRGLEAKLCVAWPTVDGMVEMLKGLLYDDGVPVIVCQRLSDEMAWSGHFRVVIGCTETEVTFHDPKDGPSITWPSEKFFDYLKRTGGNVEGGICVVISARPTKTKVSLDQAPWLEMFKVLDAAGRIKQ